MERSADCSTLNAAFCKAQSEFTPVIKDGIASMGTGGKRKYATLNAILQMALPILNSNGLDIRQHVENDPDDKSRVMVTTELVLKEKDEWVKSSFSLPPDRQGGIQGLGSAITYARRYTLSALLGISLDDDDDGEAAMRGYRQQPPAQPQQDKLSARRNEMGKMLVSSGMPKEEMPQKISEIIGRQIKSSYELSLSEIELVIKTITNKE